MRYVIFSDTIPHWMLARRDSREWVVFCVNWLWKRAREDGWDLSSAVLRIRKDPVAPATTFELSVNRRSEAR